MILLFLALSETIPPLVDPPPNTVLYCSQFISLRRFGEANCGPRSKPPEPANERTQNFMTSRFKPVVSLALAMLLCLSLGACALPSPVPVEDGAANTASDFAANDGSVQQAGGSYVVDISDMAGNALRLSAYPSRIVVLDPADCEILYAIGAGDTIVGRNSTCNYPVQETSAIPFVTINNEVDPDLVLLREPDLVIMSAEQAANAELISALNSKGIAVLVTNATDVNNMYGAISLLGTVTNHATEATALVSKLITSLAELQTKISSHNETVYLELTPLAEGMTTAGSGTIFNAIVAQLGYHNEFEDQPGYPAVTQDQVVGRNPDIIITTKPNAQAGDPAAETPDPASVTPDPALTTPDPALGTPDPSATDDPNAATPASTLTGPQEILARDGWGDVDAVKNQRVYYIDAGLLLRAGPRILEGIDALYTALYENKQPQFN